MDVEFVQQGNRSWGQAAIISFLLVTLGVQNLRKSLRLLLRRLLLFLLVNLFKHLEHFSLVVGGDWIHQLLDL